MLIFFKKTPFLQIITFSLLVAYSIIQAKFYLSDAFIPDEIWFLELMKNTRETIERNGLLTAIFSEHNRLGYGSLYWIYGAIIADKNILRIFALIFMLSIPVFLFLIGKKIKAPTNNICFAILIWISFPAAWWYGKLIGPELLSCFLGMLSAYLFLHKRALKILSAMLLGIAIAIKLNAITYVFFIAAIHFKEFYEPKKGVGFFRRLRDDLPLIFSGVLGFIIGNPFVISEPLLFLETLNEYSLSGLYTVDGLLNTLFNKNWWWGGVFVGGLFDLSLGIIPCILLLYFFFFKFLKFREGSTYPAALLISFLLSIPFIMKVIFSGWYWLPFITLLPILFLCVRTNKTKMLNGILGLILLCNIYSGYEIISLKIDMRRSHIQNMKSKESILKCLENKTRQFRYKFPEGEVNNYSEIGFVVENKPVFNIYPRKINPIGYNAIARGEMKTPSLNFIGKRFPKTDKNSHPGVLAENMTRSGYKLKYDRCYDIDVITVY